MADAPGSAEPWPWPANEWQTIQPDGKEEREVRAAADTRYEDWIDPRLITWQSLKLTSAGIEHSPVKHEQKPPLLPRPAVNGNQERKSI